MKHYYKSIPFATQLRSLWSSLKSAFYSNPNQKTAKNLTKTRKLVEWEQYQPNNRKYLEIGNELIMKRDLHKERYDFWDKLYPISSYL